LIIRLSFYITNHMVNKRYFIIFVLKCTYDPFINDVCE
jgi:hypothetical protein